MQNRPQRWRIRADRTYYRFSTIRMLNNLLTKILKNLLFPKSIYNSLKASSLLKVNELSYCHEDYFYACAKLLPAAFYSVIYI